MKIENKEELIKLSIKWYIKDIIANRNFDKNENDLFNKLIDSICQRKYIEINEKTKMKLTKDEIISIFIEGDKK